MRAERRASYPDDSPRRPRRDLRSAARILWFVIAAATVDGCSDTHCGPSRTVSAPPDEAGQTAEPSRVRSDFLVRLRHLAEAGNLFDPQAAAQILGITLRSSTRELLPPIRNCGDGTTSKASITTVTALGPSWFHTLPTGAGHIEIPAFTINPATVSGDPALEYHIYHSVWCRDWPRLQDATEANLGFDGLPAFTCLTPASITAGIPGAQFVLATDGVSLVTFQGRVGDDSGTTLTFQFRAGAACALYAELRQSQEGGLRYRRAVYKYQLCRAPSDREFCFAHGNITWSDSELIKKMAEQAYEKCGTVNSLYVKEPATGDAPPPLPQAIKKSPCEGL